MLLGWVIGFGEPIVMTNISTWLLHIAVKNKFRIHYHTLVFHDSDTIHCGWKEKHDKIRWHRAKITQDECWEFGWSVLSYTPYYSDLAPANYYFLDFYKSLWSRKLCLMKTRFKNLIENFFAWKPVEFYWKSIEILSDKWQHLISNNSEYIIK